MATWAGSSRVSVCVSGGGCCTAIGAGKGTGVMSMKYSCDVSSGRDVLVLAAYASLKRGFDMFSVDVGGIPLVWPFSVVLVFFFFLLRSLFFPFSEDADLDGTASSSRSEVRSTKF